MRLTYARQEKCQADGKKDGEEQAVPRTDQTQVSHAGLHPIFTQDRFLRLSLYTFDVTQRHGRLCHPGARGLGCFDVQLRHVTDLIIGVNSTTVKNTISDSRYMIKKIRELSKKCVQEATHLLISATFCCSVASSTEPTTIERMIPWRSMK